jgi:FkbH-like protein
MTDDLYSCLAWLPPPPRNFAELCQRASESAGEIGAQLKLLASYALDQNQLARLARIVQHESSFGVSLQPLTPFRLGLLSNSTTDFILPALVATATRYGLALEVIPGNFDQCLQDALSPDSLVNRAAPDAVLIALDYRGLALFGSAGNNTSAQTRVLEALEHLRTIRSAIKRNSSAICILQTLAPPPETLFGSLDASSPGSLARTIDGVNSGLSSSLPGMGDVLFDVAHLAATVGLTNWYSPRDWNLGKLPFSDVFVPLYADHLCRIIAALRGKSRRCLVLDLDNTLWGGVIGDDGLEGIQLAQGDPTGEAFLSVQRLALDLRARGIVLAVCSKNEDKIARLPFRHHPEMLLREEHIAIFQANWRDKPCNIKAIASELSLGLDSMVFLDDNPFERDLVRQTMPDVAVPELPADPAFYARTLNAAGYFEAANFSPEDSKRAAFYQGNARRATLQQSAGGLESYLASLDMEITFRPFDETGRTRIAQLINKANQFNLTTRRYSEQHVAEMQRDPAYFTAQVRLTDRFGDNGMISVVICHEDSPGEWSIDTWLMSCRVLGRRVEDMVLQHLLDHAKKHRIQKLRGVYIPTDRNMLVAQHYSNLGFTQVTEDGQQLKTYELAVADAPVAEAHMRVRCFCCEASKRDEIDMFLPKERSTDLLRVD